MNYLGFALQSSQVQTVINGSLGQSLAVVTQTSMMDGGKYAWAMLLIDSETGQIRHSDWHDGYPTREDARAVGVDMNLKAIMPWCAVGGSA